MSSVVTNPFVHLSPANYIVTRQKNIPTGGLGLVNRNFKLPTMLPTPSLKYFNIFLNTYLNIALLKKESY